MHIKKIQSIVEWKAKRKILNLIKATTKFSEIYTRFFIFKTWQFANLINVWIEIQKNTIPGSL